MYISHAYLSCTNCTTMTYVVDTTWASITITFDFIAFRAVQFTVVVNHPSLGPIQLSDEVQDLILGDLVVRGQNKSVEIKQTVRREDCCQTTCTPWSLSPSMISAAVSDPLPSTSMLLNMACGNQSAKSLLGDIYWGRLARIACGCTDLDACKMCPIKLHNGHTHNFLLEG